MPGLLNHLSGTLEMLDVRIDPDDQGLLNTIKLPKELGLITERLPKPQYQIKRTQSLPPEKILVLPEIKPKENLIQVAHRILD